MYIIVVSGSLDVMWWWVIFCSMSIMKVFIWHFYNAICKLIKQTIPSLFQHVFSIKPFENSPQCICHVPSSGSITRTLYCSEMTRASSMFYGWQAKTWQQKMQRMQKKIQNTQPLPNFPIEPDKLAQWVSFKKVNVSFRMNFELTESFGLILCYVH